MASLFDSLLEKVHEIHDLSKAGALLSWDREVIMPRAAEEIRIRQMTTVQRFVHELFVSEEMGELIEGAAAELDGAGGDGFAPSLVRLLQYDYERARKLPPDYVRREAETSGRAHGIWRDARAADDFASFQPILEQIVALGQEKAELYGYEDEPYDALLEGYERATTTAEVRAVFDAVKAETLPLLQAIQERGREVDDSLLYQQYDVERQKEVARYLAAALGYDFERGYMGTAVHPFASSFSRNDARITGRWYPDFLSPAILGVMHESGHAIYEQGTHPDLQRTPLARGTSAGIHESQSRLFENVVGRSRGWWRAHFPKLQEAFPAQLGDYTAEDFYLAVNKVQPSLIRVEADELTYNLHIILRFELEQALINGEVAAADLPEAWNEKMQALLGITPPTNREGVLQDIHWTWPSFGYFPTYALGNLYAAQFYAAASEQEPQILEEKEAGKTDTLLAWLRENVHQHGRKFPPAELVQRATGRALSHEPFVAYVTKKFSDVYAL
ncbi:MAG: carboxypeptidase M32 [Anaerolineae bacterium]|nr:carboxypeptidase M32 [Anaerolineae bacterium]